MKVPSRLALAGALILTAGCVTPQKTAVWVSPEAKSGSSLTYAILPFADANAKPDKEKFPEAAKVVQEAFETAFLESGHKVVASGNEEASVQGTVTCFYRGAFGGRYTTVGVEVKAVTAKSGAVLWKASYTKRTQWDYKYEPAMLAREVAAELVKELTASGRLP
jgi:TolB-like protein